MPYIGNTIRAADDYRLIDDISSAFNGSTTSFALQVAGSAPVPFPKSPQQVLISVNGVIQEPDPTGASGFNLVGTNIVFSSAPTNGHAFFGIIYATADYLNSGGNFPSGSLGAPSITFVGDEDTGIYRKGSGSIGFVSDSTEIANTDSNGITISSGNLIIPDSIIHNGDSDTKIRFPSANTVSVETGGAERLKLSDSIAIFNDDGSDVDFKVEGDTDTALFYVEAGNDRVGIGTSVPTGKLTIASGAFQTTTPTSTGDDIVISGNQSLGIQFLTLASGSSNNNIYFGDTDDADIGMIRYAHADNSLRFRTNTAERFKIANNGELLSTYDITSDGDASLILDTDDTSKAPSLMIQAGGERRGRFLMQRLAGDGCSMRIQVAKMDNSNLLLDAITIAPTASGDDTPDSTFNGDVIAKNVSIDADIMHTGDTNNKIVFTTDTQQFFTDGSTRLEIQDDGDILFNDEISFHGTNNAIRTNIPSTRAFGSNSNRNTLGKITIRAGDADNTSIDDNNCAIKIYPAGNRATTGAPAYGGIAWNHLDPEVYAPATYNGSTCWLGPTVHDLSGQERDNFEIRMNSQTGTGTQPNVVGFRLSPEGYHSLPTTPIFIGEGTNYTQDTSGSSYSDVIPHYDLTIRGISRSGAELTVPEDGVYFFSITYLFHPNDEADYMSSRIVVNGSQAGDIIQGGGNQTGHENNTFTKLLNLSSSDVVKFQFKTDTGKVFSGQTNWAFYKVA